MNGTDNKDYIHSLTKSYRAPNTPRNVLCPRGVMENKRDRILAFKSFQCSYRSPGEGAINVAEKIGSKKV